MNIKRFNETKSKEDEVTGVDIKSFEDDKDVVGFARDNDELTDGAEKKLKQEIQVTTPGLKKSIKKFEDFSVKITIDEEGEGSVDTEDCSTECCQECGCEPCECQGQLDPKDFCDACDCNPCKCGEETGKVNNGEVVDVIPFADFLNGIL
jgi:hypothetical protein